MVPYGNWMQAGQLRSTCGISYTELYSAASSGMLERKVVDKHVYYRNKQRSLFEVGQSEIIQSARQ